jgi:hypothetical protein
LEDERRRPRCSQRFNLRPTRIVARFAPLRQASVLVACANGMLWTRFGAVRKPPSLLALALALAGVMYGAVAVPLAITCVVKARAAGAMT